MVKMNKRILLFLSLTLLSCFKNEVKQYDDGNDPAVDRSGRQYDFLDASRLTYCGAGWGRKFCRFLANYDGTIWADSAHYYSEFSDIKFSNFTSDPYFISFFQLDSITSYCKGWRLGENTRDGLKWEIEIKKDEEEVFWFSVDNYDSNDALESSTLHKYEVIEGLLHFSTTGGQTFVFHPSEKNYAENTVGTEEIRVMEGCMFN